MTTFCLVHVAYVCWQMTMCGALFARTILLFVPLSAGYTGGIGSMESILGILKSFKIWALHAHPSDIHIWFGFSDWTLQSAITRLQLPEDGKIMA